METKKLSRRETEHIHSCFLFDSVPPELTERLLQSDECEIRDYKKGEIIFDRERYLYSAGLILSGSVLVSSPSGSRSLMMRELDAGDIFGVAALFTDKADYVTTLTAKSACRVLFMGQELLRRAMRENFTLAENYIRFLSGRLRFLNKKISGLAAGSAEEALAIYLSDFEGGADIPSYSRLAEELGLGRASLYRALDSLEKSALIKRDGHNIQITDFEGLKEIIQ